MKTSIKTVHIVFKTHLDIGFTDTARNVLDQYVDSFIPKAIELADHLADKPGPEKFVWTTGSWLIRYYLDHAAPEDRAKMEEAIQKGHIVWHGLPFTTHSELMDKRLFEFGLSMSSQLDRTYGKQTITAKMTDVPGHTIGIVPLLSAAGIRYLHLGTNPASKAPDVPQAFVWKAADGAEVIVNYNDSYGEAMVIPGFDEVLYFSHTLDNIGPPSVEDIHKLFVELAEQFPNAVIQASTMDAFADKLWSYKASLPVVREEIGDSWIYGAASDPWKIAAYRELLRLRDKWIAEGTLVLNSEQYDAFCHSLIMVPEHTWGLDMKKYLPDFVNYAKKDFAAARKRDIVGEDLFPLTYEYTRGWSAGHTKNTGKTSYSYSEVESSWNEQRNYVQTALMTLDADKRREAEEALKGLRPERAASTGYNPISIRQTYRLGLFEAEFAEDGSISLLRGNNGKVWADDNSRIGRYSYETFGLPDYRRWYEQYTTYWDRNLDWISADFGKPAFEFAKPYPTNRMFEPSLVSLSVRHANDGDYVQAKLRMSEQASEIQGAPRELELLYRFAKDAEDIDLTLNWFGKDAHRLPEGSWIGINPIVNNPNLWKMDKLGSLLSPLEVVKNGNRGMHAIESRLTYSGADGEATIRTWDAPVVSIGKPRLLQFDNLFADLSGGYYFNLHNNAWGTNFRMWYEEDARFRYTLTFRSN
ncbi:DUF5054 domain-containing protein [Cohnella herbarum]|uniref:DUF5054 domain-containing protein n=1 Tax=Cohnella herbarum TaxID=2728023 RepID=A0A7Z2VSQ5_9BACL|nr:DUF5054 domain-containing protein [Cohnella herbarum]